MIMKGALYARVSTQRQEKRGTIASQVDALRSYAKEHEHEIMDEYVCCDDGYSGAILARPELDRLRDGAQAGAFDAILVLSPDRLSRKYAYLILILEEFERFGTAVIFLEQPLGDDPHSALLVQIQGAVAEYERAKMAERYRRGKLYRARQGEVFWASIPYGYRRIPRRDGIPAHLVVNESEATIVKRIFVWHACESMSIRQIAKRLTREGYSTPKGGKLWGETTVHRFLRREAYLGTLYYNQSQDVTVMPSDGGPPRTKKVLKPRSEWIAVSIPPIIDQETFDRSQAQHGPNRQFSPRNLHEERWLLRRLLRCAKCGLKCACVADKRRPHMPPSYYYRCEKQDRVLGRPRCQPNHLRSEPLDELVWTEIRRHLLEPKLLIEAHAKLGMVDSLDDSVLSTQLRNTNKRTSQVQTERRRLIDAFQGGFIAKEEFEERCRIVARRISELQTDLKDLEAQHQQSSQDNQLLSRLSNFTSTITERLDCMTFHERQALARELLEEVVISDNVVKLYFKIPLPNAEQASSQKKLQTKARVSSELILRSRRGYRRWNLSRRFPLGYLPPDRQTKTILHRCQNSK
jgi:site-specific DNA recombinase